MPDGNFRPGPAPDTAAVTELRKRMWSNGWAPIPVTDPRHTHPDRGKAPVMPGWNRVTAENLTAAAIEGWAVRPHEGNTGLVCGRLTVLDLDCAEPALAERLRELAFTHVGPTPFRRIGRAPRMALLYRAAEPIAKRLTPILFLPDGEKVQVEVLGAGQQAVAYGIHPNTGRPYEWPHASPDSHRFDELPETTPEALDGFLAAAEAAMRKAGAAPKEEPEEPEEPRDGFPDIDLGPRPRGDHAPPTVEEVADALRFVPNDEGWEKWFRIGAAIFDAIGDDGEELFAEWSARSARNDPDNTRRKWRSFRTCPPKDVRRGSLFFEARRNGWRPQRPERPEPQPGPQPEPQPQPEPEAKADAPKSKARRLILLTVDDCAAAPPREYLVEGLIAPGELSVWWGPPKCGKSFLLLHIAYRMAQGMALWGREVQQSAAIYLAAEGQSGIKGRVVALRDRHGRAEQFRLVAQTVNLFDPEADLGELIELARELGCRLIVVDTLARTMVGGDENQTRDMTAFVRNLDRIREESGAHVAVVHHCGWEGSHARGSIALIGAADLVVKVTGGKDEPKAAMIEYAKDDESGHSLGFDLETVELPPDARGRERRTLIVRENSIDLGAEPAAKAERPLTETQRGWLKDLQDMFATPDLAQPRVPMCDMSATLTLHRSEVRDGFRVRGRFEQDNPHGPLTPANRQKLSGMLNLLKDKRKIGLTADYVWLL